MFAGAFAFAPSVLAWAAVLEVVAAAAEPVPCDEFAPFADADCDAAAAAAAADSDGDLIADGGG